jgi:lipopolysaccharide transport system ATP-binding protein
MSIQLKYSASNDFSQCKKSHIDIGINDYLGSRISWISTKLYMDQITNKNETTFKIEQLMLKEGTYNLNIYVTTEKGIAFWVKNIAKFNIYFNDYYRTGRHIPTNQGPLITRFSII